MKKLTALIISAAMLASALPFAAVSFADTASTNTSARQMEYLDRGTVAVKVSSGVYLSWRLLGTENYDTSFDVYRDNTYLGTVKDSTNFSDAGGTESNKYTVVVSGEDVSEGKAVDVWGQQYLSIPITAPTYSCTFEGTDYDFTYTANDASCADLDGDGEYEIILKWDPSGSFDSGSSHSGPSGNVFIDAYKLNGTRLWRMDLGENISAGAHFTQIAAYDFDLDGKGEIAFKTAPGSKDGKGNYVSAASSIDAIKNTANNETDYRQSDGRVMQGDEYYTVFDGETGAALDTIYYPHPRDCHDSDWGDGGTRWNRSERFLTTVAYLDGVTPSIIAWRGYYAKTTVTAYNLINKKLVKAADFDTDDYSGVNADKEIAGQGNHNTTVGDVDGDGMDEILCGGLCLELTNGDFSVKWTTETGHGDALHLADYDPTHEGMEYFIVHEHEPYGMSVVYPETGDIVYHKDGAEDTGRGIMANYNGNGYYQIWGVGTDYKDDTGFNNYDESGSLTSKSANFRIFWDGDVYDELWDGTGSTDCSIGIESGAGNTTGRIMTINTGITNNGTKKNACLQADLLGDWREELVIRNSDSTELQLYTTTTPTSEKLYTLMQDSAYRMQVAGQNSAYNQPPHISYYINAANDENDTRIYADYVKTVYNGVTSIRTANLPANAQTETTPVPEKSKITATKVRNEIGTDTSTPPSGSVWLNYYNNTWGVAYFGFSGISNFNPVLLESASIEFTAISYATTNRNRQFFFDLFGTDNTWEAGTVSVSSDPYPSSATKISSTECYTQNAAGDVLKPDVAALFDVTDYVKELSKGTTEMSFIAAIPSGSGGAGACELLMNSSPTLILTYKAVTLSEIAVTPPEKTTYIEGQELDTTGMTVTAVYNDDSTGTVEVTDCVITGYDKTKTGKQTITVTYGEYTDTFDVEVIARAITGITVTPPEKTTYIEGEELDLSGMEVTAAYNDNSTDKAASSSCTVTGYDKTKIGKQTVTVKYGGYTDTFDVTVKQKSLTGITVTPPTKTAYYVGEELDLSGMEVTAAYNDNSTDKAASSSCTVTGYDNTKIGKQTITVTYEGKTATFDVNVTERPRTDAYINIISDTTSVSGGTLTGAVTAKLENYNDAANLILAVYDGDGALLQAQIKNSNGAEVAFDALNISEITDYTYKIFAWKNVTNLEPVCHQYPENAE
ncbi:MAG: bacterial Ig-like domain-containing protein [Hominilimicola sp.]